MSPVNASSVTELLHGLLDELAPAAVVSDAAAAERDRILDASLVRSVFQPIVDLETGETVAFEALSRGPAGSSLELPGAPFGAAEAAGRLAELEWACRVSAFRAALAGGLRPPRSLFVNVEPSMIAAPVPALARDLLEEARTSLDIVVELTERAVASRPGDILAAVPFLRDMGCAIAVDDVGADRRSLALMPFLRPEVIKLDLSLVQENPTPQIASIMHAVNAAAERTGAAVLAEGIETEAHVVRARALGADYVQGWHFGRPGALPADGAAAGRRLAGPRAVSLPAGATPFEVVTAHRETRRGTKDLLLQFSLHLEAHVAAQSEAAVLLATFQDARHLTERTRRRYARLAQRAALVGALGVDVAPEPAPGVRGAAITAGDALEASGTSWSSTRTSPRRSSPATSATAACATATGGSISASPTTAIWPSRRRRRCCRASYRGIEPSRPVRSPLP